MNQFERINPNDDLSVTLLENIFINHYMPKAPGDFVKVYLLGLKYSQSQNLPDISNRVIAKTLKILESDVVKAWEFWQNEGIIKIEPDRNNDQQKIKYYNIASLMIQGKKTSISMKNPKQKKESFIEGMYRSIEYIFARPLSSKELKTIESWRQDFHFTPQMIILLIEYCVDKGKKDFNYMNTVARSWRDRNITNEDLALEHIEKTNKRWKNYYAILKYLGFRRQPSQPETQMMDKWLDTYGQSMDLIYEACKRMSGIGKPNFKYLDTILSDWYKNGITTPEEANQKDTKAARSHSNDNDDSPQVKYDYDLIEEKLKKKMWGDGK
ncbi:MAG TPA: DNA replication protein DnaD [Eubacteriaceae bacterium]|nr:DNA replication protein DnaD [Eubacteriaceae bacterium]